ncbi:MAG: hypothetical protein PHX82_04615 [Paracoccaceae bacterium]|jgi:hypothetical protein|nr:hypothetical protein [Paracoccaceae bacterium]
MLIRLLPIVLLAALPARAEPPSAPECRVLESTGDRFCKQGPRWVLSNATAPTYAPGDAFPIYDHSMLMDLARYNLPPVDGPWRYYVVEGTIYKVSSTDATVLGVVGRARR